MENTLEKALKQESKVLALIKMKQNQKFISLMMACWLPWQSVWSWVNYPASLGLILSIYKMGKCHCFSIMMNSKGYNKCEWFILKHSFILHIGNRGIYPLLYIFGVFLKKKKKNLSPSELGWILCDSVTQTFWEFLMANSMEEESGRLQSTRSQ